jgi:signal transduction histidine kinase
MIDTPAGPAASGETLAAIAHEYSNLLTVIGGSVALAERHAVGNPALIRLLDNMRIAAERAVALTERLSGLAGTAEIPVEPAPASAPPAACVLEVEDDPKMAAVTQ